MYKKTVLYPVRTVHKLRDVKEISEHDNDDEE
jgi:hypothetical protein